MGLGFAGKRRKGKIKMCVNELEKKKVKAKIKPGLVGLRLGLNVQDVERLHGVPAQRWEVPG